MPAYLVLATARRAFKQCRAAVDLRASAGTGLGREEQRRRAAHADHRKQAPPQAGRRRRQPHLIFTKPRVVYRMPKGETQNQEEA